MSEAQLYILHRGKISKNGGMHRSYTFVTALILAITCLAIAAYAAKPEALASRSLQPNLEAQMALPFRDNAVLQQKMELPVWGRSLPGATVTVKFDGQSRTVTADAEGKWHSTLDPMTAVRLKSVNDSPTGKSMTIVCQKDGQQATKTIKNLLVGDVWLCAGQSNMAGTMRRAIHPKNYPPNSIPEADYSALRYLSVADDSWLVCSPETAVKISRVGFYFIRRVQRDALVSMGIMVTAVGGSKIESWLNQPPYPTGKNYEVLLQPLVGYGIRGAVWYQGESNESNRRAYHPKLKSLILGWRKAWGQGDFPVHFVQLPGLKTSNRENPAGGDGRAEIRQAYVDTLAVENTGMAVTIDVGTPGDGTWHWAEAQIDGSDLIVSAKGVEQPKAVRYAYTAQPLGNLLYNKDGLPVGPFTTCGYESR